jgi:hypothetical protein
MTSTSSPMTPTRSATLPFLRYELRRHLATLGLGLLALVVLPITQRLMTDDFAFWDGAWNVWGAVLALYVVMPLLVLAMAASGWSRERSLHTLEWLYSRPISSGLLFAARAVALVVPAVAWSVAALVLHAASGTELAQALSTAPVLPGPAALYAAQLALALGAGLFASALARSPETAFRGSLLLVGATWIAVLVVTRVSGPGPMIVAAAAAGYSRLLSSAVTIFVFGVAAALTSGAWLGVARDLDGSRRSRRATRVTGIAASIALGTFVALVHLPYLALGESPFATSLGNERGLTFRGAPGLPNLAHPVFEADGRSTVLRGAFVFSPQQSWTFGAVASAERAAAIVAAYPTGDGAWKPRSENNRWLFVEADGHARDLALPAMGDASPMGWSPSGRRFAWKWSPWWSEGRSGDHSAWREPAHLQILEEDLTLREVAVPAAIPAGWRMAWLDDHTILVADVVRRNDEEGEDRWAILDLDHGPAPPSAVAPHDVPPGLALAAPALYDWAFGSAILPRLDGSPVVLLVDAVAADPTHRDDGTATLAPRLARIDAVAGTLEPGPELSRETSALSMGNLRDGSLVWASPERTLLAPRWDGGTTAKLYHLDSFAGAPRLLCTLPTGRVARFVGESGSWAIWESIWFPDYRLWGCNVETGEARELVEWQPWAHALATIGERGLWTPQGWKPVAP